MRIRLLLMRRGYATVLGSAAFVAGCSLFSDLGGFSGDSASTNEGGTPETGDSDSGVDDAAPETDAPVAIVDAGPDASPYMLAVLADRPIAYWPMDDAPGCALVTELVGGKNADFAGVLTCGVPGVSGTAIDKTKVEQVLAVGDYFDFVGFNPYTIEAWAKPRFEAQYLTMIAKRRPNTPFGWNFYFQDVDPAGAPGFQMLHVSPDGGNRTVFVATPDAASKFHHIVVTYDPNVATGAPLRMYYDGVRTDGYDDDIPASDTTEPVWIGEAYTGLLDEIALYDHALGAERVQAHYQLGKK